MAELVIIYGKSGSGKTRSLKNFGEDEILLINCMGKRPPFSKKFPTRTYCDYPHITDQLIRLANSKCRAVVIDDAGYLMTSTFMAGHSSPKSGSSSFDLFNSIADDFWRLILTIKSLPDDMIVYMMLHEEESDFGSVKLRTIGKLLDQKVCIEGTVTICLRCVIKDKKHLFITNGDGSDITKSPEDMFPPEIENDLKAVDTRIREFWGLAPIKDISEEDKTENKDSKGEEQK